MSCLFASNSHADLVKYFPESFQENLRATLDLSTRISHNDDTNNNHHLHVAGLDLHKVFSNDTGDWATVRAQLYLLRQENGPGGPAHPFLEGSDDWELQPRFLDVNFTALGEYIPNVRIGHFEVPYGLEQIINTNGTLLDYRHPQNIGRVKPDWGVTLYFSELGRYTMYVPHKEGKPVGLVHSRAVETKVGLFEVVWAYDLDLKVKDFTIQRCRSRHARKLESEDFRNQLRGKGFDEIRAMLSEDAKEISDKIDAPSRTEDLVAALLRNCLKTIAVSESAWGEEIKAYRAQL